MRRSFWGFAQMSVFLLGSSSTAFAYCRTTTQAPPRSSCPEPCDYTGHPLFWPLSTLTYTFNEELFPDVTEEQLRSIFRSSFETWEAVECTPADGSESVPLGFDIVADVATTTEREGHVGVDPAKNHNVIFHLSQEEWNADPTLPRRGFALTSIWFEEATGKILGADMQFNGNLDPFGICPSQGCSDGTIDLQDVATHEAGHFLGLAHSDDPVSTMSCDASPGDVSKRSLGQDDVDGICAAYPPGKAFEEPDAGGSRASGCAISDASSEQSPRSLGQDDVDGSCAEDPPERAFEEPDAGGSRASGCAISDASSEQSPRSLGQDDVDGSCAADLPERAFEEPDAGGSRASGCAVSDASSEQSLLSALASALAALLLFRRRAQKR